MLAASNPPGITSQESSQLSQTKTAFFFKLERELEKVNEFYIQKENEFTLRLDSLIKKSNAPMNINPRLATSSRLTLKEAFLQFQIDLAKLQKFVEVNATGFRKILKKWDKRAKSSTKEIYLSRQIEVQPCFNNEVLTELADKASNHLAELENYLQNTNPEILELSKPSKIEKSSSAVFSDIESELISLLFNNNLNQVWLNRYLETNVLNADVLSRVYLDYCTEVNVDLLRLLLDTNLVDCNLTDGFSDHTCLHELAIAGKFEAIQLSIEYKANVSATDVYGRTPLHYAGMYGHQAICLFLISVGANSNVIDQDGNSPLIYSIINGHIECCLTLLEQNSIEFEPSSATSPIPLSLACQYGHLQIVDLLLLKGAQLIPNIDGLYPLHLACREGKSDITRRLIQHGANIEAKDAFYGWTPVFFAASEGHVECIKLLIEAGCVIRIKDEHEWLPWTYSLYRGHMKASELLTVKDTNVSDGQNHSNQSVPSNVCLLENNGLQESVMDKDPLDNIISLDLDDIPSLSLPPPIIPLRIYGHHYLDKKYLIQIQLGQYRKATNPSPVRFYGSKQLSSLRLKITCKPETDLSFFCHLPLKDDVTVFSYTLEEIQDLSFEFDIYPAFGTKTFGKSGITTSQLKNLIKEKNGDGIEGIEYITTIFDNHLRIIGELSFMLSIVKPFSHHALQIGGKIETYWKAITVVTNTSKSHQSDLNHSLVTSTSLDKEYFELVVQTTKDHKLVVYPNWYIKIFNVDILLSMLNYDQAKSIFQSLNPNVKKYEELKSDIGMVELIEWIYSSFLTLEEILQKLPTTIGISIILKYPTPYQREKQFIHTSMNINNFVDSILKVIYDHTEQVQEKNHSIIFSSFNKALCTVMNWKQPNYGVFFRTYCGYDREDELLISIKESIKFAKECDLLGLICESQPLLEMPVLIQTIKESGLILGTFGNKNKDQENISMQEQNGVDAVIVDGIFKYNMNV
ncbi:hypothetical protein BC833DRAFT_596827 [Globomyces pollinis-pini]|nr:hypothetical protein BC833DRAFT_596827 [Globomyces pollinis-pini]